MVRIIAEASANHCGSLYIANKLLAEVAKTGCHFIKYQLYDPKEDICEINHVNYPAGIREVISRDQEIIGKSMLDLSWLPHLKSTALELGINLIFSCSDPKLLSLARQYSTANVIKIASCDATNLGLLERCTELFDEIIISTGAISFEEANLLKKFLTDDLGYQGNIMFLYCISEYPVERDDLNLSSINDLKKILGVQQVGYSDHFKGIDACLASLAYTPCLIEKHVQLPGTKSVDTPVSCTVGELKMLNDIVKLSEQVSKERKGENIMLRRSAYIKNIPQWNTTHDFSAIDYVRPGFGLPLCETLKVIRHFKEADMSATEFAQNINDAWLHNEE